MSFLSIFHTEFQSSSQSVDLEEALEHGPHMRTHTHTHTRTHARTHAHTDLEEALEHGPGGGGPLPHEVLGQLRHELVSAGAALTFQRLEPPDTAEPVQREIMNNRKNGKAEECK